MRRTIPFLFTALIALPACAQIRVLAAADSASYQEVIHSGGGSLLSVFCTGLEQEENWQAAAFPLPTSLRGIEVTMGGIPAPLLSFSRLSGYQQINIQVPLEVNISSGYLDVRVLRGGVASEPRRVVVAEWPALFRLPDNSGIFLRAADWSLITPAQPARPGELLITFSTGLRGHPPVPAGQPNPSEPPAILSLNLNPSISSGPHFRQGSVRRVIGAWWAPGLAGVQQIHFEAPDNYPSSGRVEVAIDLVTCMQPFPGQPTQCRVGSGIPVILWMQPR